MANPNPKNQFKKNHTYSKGNQGAKRRVVYDALWKEALETDGHLFLQKLREHRDCEDSNVSVRACEVFFKYSRPPERLFKEDGLKFTLLSSTATEIDESQGKIIEEMGKGDISTDYGLALIKALAVKRDSSVVKELEEKVNQITGEQLKFNFERNL